MAKEDQWGRAEISKQDVQGHVLAFLRQSLTLNKGFTAVLCSILKRSLLFQNLVFLSTLKKSAFSDSMSPFDFISKKISVISHEL